MIVNAKLMAQYAVAFNIGADILGKGNRAIDAHLGAEKKSGDTVYVPIMDSGKVYETLDLTGKDLSVTRDEVPVNVRPLSVGAAVTQEELTLSIDNPEIMTKRVAKIANEANLKAYRTLVEGSQAFVCTTKDVQEIKDKSFRAEAYTVGSKMGGETYGVTHPQTWNQIVSSLSANFAANPSVGQKQYGNELGDFMGFKWCKGSESSLVVGTDTNFGNVTLNDGSDVFTSSLTGPANPVVGQIAGPFTIGTAGQTNAVYAADALGIPTGYLKSFRAIWNGRNWRLTTPVYFTGARINAYSSNFNSSTGILPATASTPQLTVGTNYLSPAVIWKDMDFLVAVKGLEKFAGSDSFTVPTAYKDRGILPLRGTFWTDPVKASSIFRVDVLMGTAMYQGVSNSAIYIQA
jgi:hypothetical protein